jgi:glycosyltransferase involved in cell wall biosynthesis
VKVAFLLTQDRGGPVDLTIGLALELAGRAAGPEVVVVGPPSLAEAGLPRSLLLPAEISSKIDMPGYAAVSKCLDELAPDIIHAQDRRAGLVSAVVARRRSQVVLTFHGVPDSAAGRWVQSGPLHGRRPGISGCSRLVADALVARRLRCLVAPSGAMAVFLHRELRVPASRLRVVHNGVTCPPDGKQANDVRTFATAGSFAPCKATPLLVATFMEISANRTDLRLMMIGDGAERHYCEEIARRGQAGCQVEFTGYQRDVGAQLHQADAFVLPSFNENLPLALLQAMALGLPCIASNVGGVAEVLNEDCGMLVPPGDGQALRVAMERLIDEPGLAARLGTAARRRVVERFSQARCADSHLRLWSEILRDFRG